MKLSRFALSLSALLAPYVAIADAEPAEPAGPLTLTGMGDKTIGDILMGYGRLATDGAYFICAAIFIAGAFFYVASVGNDTLQGYGKGMMIGSVVGALVIAGANGIMNTVLYFLQLGPS